MYAYVRYTEDNVQMIVSTHDIQNFHPKNLDDFSAKKRYRILWKRTPEERGSYYDGQILKLADNEGDFNKVRIPVPPVESEDEEPASANSGSGIKQKEKKTQMAKARRDSLLDIMKVKKAKITQKREREESDEKVSVPYKLHKELQEKYILIKKRCKDNDILLARKTATIQTLQEKNKELSEELKTIRSLNLRLQEQLLSTPECLRDRLVRLNYPQEAIEQQLALVRRGNSEKISDIRKRGPQTGKTKTLSTETAE